jgi:hypothetical protein
MASNVIYSTFPTLVPSTTDKVVGIVNSDGNLYCRRCVEKLKMSFDNTKYITRTKANTLIYNCCVCGWRITKNRITNYD